MRLANNLKGGGNELRDVVAEVLTAVPAGPNKEGRVIYRSDLDRLQVCIAAGTPGTWVTVLPDTVPLNSIANPTAARDMNSQRITNLGAPTAGTDAARKQDVDVAIAGIDVHPSVRAATTVNGVLATAYENGDVIDGVTLATGDRILLKNQTTQSENGIFTVNATGAPTRATDADTAGDLSGGSFVFVEEGTTQAETGWIITTNGSITPGTTAHAWSQFSGNGSVEAGAGLTRVASGAGSQIDVVGGPGITVAADLVSIDTAVVGTKALLNIVGDGSTTQFSVSSPTGLPPYSVEVWDTDTTTQEKVEPIVEYLTASTTVRISFSPAPPVGYDYQVRMVF